MNLPSRIIPIVTFLIVSIFSNAQQDPRSSFFWNNYMHTNPAMTGAIYRHHANAQWRNQWTKINGAPTTLWLNYAMKFDSINSGIGVSYEYDAGGISRSQTALVSYAYHFPIKNMFLSLGASAGLKTLKIKGSDFIFSSQVPEDPSIFEDRQLNPVFQCDFGIAMHGENWNTGFSITQLNRAVFRDKYSSYTYKIVPHYWLFGDYTFQLGENWKLTPRAQVYTDMKKAASTIALVATVDEDIWFGFSGHLASGNISVSPMVGYDIVGKFRIGYIYEYPINSAFGSTHEIILSYQLK